MMAKSLLYCLFVPVTLLSALCSDIGIISKFVCIGNTVEVFQNITSHNYELEIILYKTFSGKDETIAAWSMQNVSDKDIHDKYKKKVSLENGTILIRDFQKSDEATYVMLYDITKRTEMQLCAVDGPDEVVVHTSENKTEVYQFSSTTVFCSANCFPPCLFRWTFSYTDIIIEGAILRLVNVTFNGSLTCHVTNPINVNATVSESIHIMEKSEDVRHKTSSVDKDQDGNVTFIDIPSIRYVLYAIPVIGGIGAIIAVVTCLWTKNIPCTSIARVSNNTINAHSDVGESNQEETLSQHYWTIVTNIKGDFFTAVESDINMELRPFVDPAEEHEAYSYSFNSDPIAIETSCSDSTKGEGYINPIHSDPTKFNEYSDPRLSHSMECNAYIHPVPSDTLEPDVYTDSTPPDYKGGIRSIDDPFSSNPGKHDEYTASACSDAMERGTNIDEVETENVETDRHLDNMPSDLV